MDLVAIVEASSGEYPGHMVIGQESESGSKYFGFNLDPDTLPRDYVAPHHWQEYLYANKILGVIQEESDYVWRIRQQKAGSSYERRIACDVPIESVLPRQTNWKHFANYSFRPDDFHSDAEPCYNCVTWATMIANTLVPGFITPVRQGRIKLIVKQFKESARKKGTGDA